MGLLIVDVGSFSLPYDYFYIKEVAKYRDIEFHCSFTKYNNEYIEKIRSLSGVKVKVWNISRSEACFFQAVYNLCLFYIFIIRFGRRYDAVHALWLPNGLIDGLLFKVFSKSFVLTCHNPFPHNVKRYASWFLRFSYSLPDKIIFVSGYSYRLFKENFARTDSLFVIQHGIMPLDFEDKDHSIDLSNFLEVDKINFVFWGRVSRYKGVDFLVKLCKFFPIIVAGKWDQNLSSEKKIIQSRGLMIDGYLSLNAIKSIMHDYNSVFVLPYLEASQSGILYTLVAEGQVFIASDVGDIGDFFQFNGLSDLLFDPNDLNSFYKAANSAVDNFEFFKAKMMALRYDYSWDHLVTSEIIDGIFDAAKVHSHGHR